MISLFIATALTALPAAKDASAAIANGLAYLDEYGANWMESRKCASCHHLAQAVWVLSEAKVAGHKVDEKFLADTLGFLSAPDNRAKTFVEASDKKPEPPQLSGGAVYALFALAALEKPAKKARDLQTSFRCRTRTAAGAS